MKTGVLTFASFIVPLILTTIILVAWKQVLIISGIAFVLIAAVVGTAYLYHEQFKYSSPGFVRLSYRKFRDKTCHRIEWE